MSEVWEAEEVATGRLVAVKVLHEALNARRPRCGDGSCANHAPRARSVPPTNVVDVLDVFLSSRTGLPSS